MDGWTDDVIGVLEIGTVVGRCDIWRDVVVNGVDDGLEVLSDGSGMDGGLGCWTWGMNRG